MTIPAPEPYTVYGTVAASMDTDGFSKKFGSSSTKAGAKGEQIAYHRLRNPHNGWLPADMPLLCSMIVPGKNSDIDFAVVKGNRILLIDAKMYRQDGGFLWSRKGGGNMMRNFSTYKTSNGNTVKLSRSMEMARNIIARELPGFTVEAIVIAVTNPENMNAKVANTRFLKFPGDVHTFNEKTAPRFIRKYFRSQIRNEDTLYAENFLANLCQ